jgi:histidine kinase
MKAPPQYQPLDKDTPIESYQSLFDLMPCIVSVQDRDFRLIKVNKRFEAEFGNRIGELCYKAYKGLDEVCPNCSVEKTFMDGKVHHSEETVIKQSGQEATILVTASPIFDAENRVIAAIEMSLDITELRMLQVQLMTSEEKYCVLFNHQPNPIFVVSLDELFVLDANDTALNDYGYSQEELLEIGFLGLASENEKQKIQKAIRERKRQILNCRQQKKDGSSMTVNILISYWHYAAQNLAIVTVIDITDQLKAQKQLAQASKLATLGQISAGVAHELNQPLSVIKSASTFLSFLAKKVIEKTTPSGDDSTPTVSIEADLLKSLTDEIDSHVNRASRIIQHLREFGRKSDFVREEINLNTCIEGALMILGRQLEVRGITTHLYLDQDLPPVIADKNRIEQVFINLIINARDAIEERQEKGQDSQEEMALNVRSFLDGKRVVVTFQDTGSGMPEEIKAKIFDPFFTTKEVGRGMGLGLSISYGIIRDYGGAIDVESETGKGTTLTVSFPRADRAPAKPSSLGNEKTED